MNQTKHEHAYLTELLERYPRLRSQEAAIWRTYEILRDCFESGGRLLIAGNGGSAADAEHITGELMKGFVKKRTLPEALRRQLQRMLRMLRASQAGRNATKHTQQSP